MSLPAILRPAAQADVKQAYEFLEEAKSGLGDEFKAQLRNVFERIEKSPEMHGTVWKDVRTVRVRRFRDIVYYVVSSSHIEIIAVVHGSRHESVWRSRGLVDRGLSS